jgi:IS4 transposase
MGCELPAGCTSGWVILITSLGAAEFTASAIGDLYRLRWRIEIAFKHLKSGVGLARPPGEDAAVAKVHVLCHLLMILLTEPLLAEQLGDSPHREAA